MSISVFEHKLLPLSEEDTPPYDFRKFLHDRKTNMGEGGDGVYGVGDEDYSGNGLEQHFEQYLGTHPSHYGSRERTEQDIEEAQAWVERMKNSDIEIYLAG